MRPVARLAGGLLLALLAVVSLLALAEVGLRVAGRLGGGAWPRTRTADFYDQVLLLRRIYRVHPYLNTSAREGATAVVFGKRAAINRLGYRSPERPKAKPPGVRRVLAAGGSTTFDVQAEDNSVTWPSQLEERLRGAEVWNAGFPGWTTLESLISLAARDLDLEPDVVLLYQGINDLQPASHEPFDPQYERGHANISRQALGLDQPPPSWLDRSLLVERLRDLVRGPSDPWQALNAKGSGRRRGRITESGVATFERNVRSFAALARSRGSAVVLMTQPIRIRAAHREADLVYLAGWYPELEPAAAPREIERLNEVLRRLAAERVGELADVARDIPWTDDDFGDPMHYAGPGRAKLVDYLVPRIP